jgi:Domain of unknown function (DUF4160)
MSGDRPTIGGMPVIHRIAGIVIMMYYRDESPPHFHAAYGGDEVKVRITPLTVLAGSLPRPQLRTVLEWAGEHQDELTAEWARAASGQPLRRIP